MLERWLPTKKAQIRESTFASYKNNIELHVVPRLGAEQLERKLSTGRRGDDEFVFCREDGSPIHPDFFSQSWDRLVKASDHRRIRLHDLRHTHATILLKAGVPLKAVSERLGHSSPAFTMTVYQHLLPRMQADAAAAFSAAVFGI